MPKPLFCAPFCPLSEVVVAIKRRFAAVAGYGIKSRASLESDPVSATAGPGCAFGNRERDDARAAPPHRDVAASPRRSDAVVIEGGIVEGVRAGHETLHRWRLDQPTPMERTRILDPAPDRNTVQLIHQRALDLLPELKGTKVTARWAGYIDSTAHGVPAIGETLHLPGLILAPGFQWGTVLASGRAQVI